MKLLNVRDPKTQEPTAVMILTNRDIRRMREEVKASPNRQIAVKIPEITALLQQLDQLMQEKLGAEKWKEMVQSGTLPVEPENNGQTQPSTP